MAKKVQVVLDEASFQLLERLAQPRAGNKSFVVREALRYFADRENIEQALDAILARREAREALDAGIAAWRQRNLVAHERLTQEVHRPKRTR